MDSAVRAANSTFIGSVAGLAVLGSLLALSLSACDGEEAAPTTRQVGVPPSVAAPADDAAPGRIRLTDEQVRTLAIRTATVTREPVGFEIGLPGTVYPAPNYFAEVSSSLSGRIASMAVNEGESVSADQVVAELESLELANLAANYLETRAELEYTRSQVTRYELLVERGRFWSLEEIRVDLKRKIERSWHSYQASREAVIRYNEVIRDRSEELLARTQEGYRLGEIDLLRLLDTQRTYLDSQRNYRDALLSYYLDLIDVERFLDREIVFNGDIQ